MINLLLDIKKLIKLRLTFLVVFSASIAFLIASKEQQHTKWKNWIILMLGGFLVTAAANGFNQIIEKDSDKLMTRTMDRPIPAGKMTSGQALVISLLMALLGIRLLVSLNPLTGVLSIFSIFLYAFLYTPLKQKSPIAVLIGAFPGAFPPLIGYFAAFTHPELSKIPILLFLTQFIWQFPHFWSIAWVLDEDYKKAGFRLLPTKKRDQMSAFWIWASTLVLLPISLLPTALGLASWLFFIIAIISGLIFSFLSFRLFNELAINSARKVMFCSFFYLPVVQLALLIDYRCP